MKDKSTNFKVASHLGKKSCSSCSKWAVFFIVNTFGKSKSVHKPTANIIKLFANCAFDFKVHNDINRLSLAFSFKISITFIEDEQTVWLPHWTKQFKVHDCHTSMKINKRKRTHLASFFGIVYSVFIILIWMYCQEWKIFV